MMIKRTLITLICAFFLLSCEKVGEYSSPTEPMISKEAQITNNEINSIDIINYIQLTYPQTKSDDIKIAPIVYNQDTILYEVKNGTYYKIFSADKRLPVTIAYSDNGSNISMQGNPIFKRLIEDEAKYLYELKNNLPDTLKNRHTKLWDRIKSRYSKTHTKAEGDPVEDEGYWRWIETDTIDINTQNTGHLIDKPWHQNHPYNTCVPYQFNSSERCAAGCVAVAGAHILYYTNQDFGIPETIPNQGNCTGWYKSPSSHDYTITFGNRTSSAWSSIHNNNSSSVATLIGWIAHNVDMTYGEQSGAYTSNFIDFLDSEGISSSFVNFNRNTAFNRVLKYREPIYVESFIVEDDGTESKHAYIMDRAKLVTYTTESLYEYVPHMNGGISTGETKYETEEVYEYYVSFRFGWDMYPYTYDDIYVYLHYWDFPSFYLPVDGRKMLYDFKAK